MSDFLPFALPDIGEEEIAEVVRCLRSGWVTTGPMARRFEQEFAEYIGHGVEAVSVNSATAGLHLALEAIGVGPGDAVITTPYTFTATAEVVRYLGADPLFADIEPRTMNIDPVAVKEALAGGSRVKAMIPVHFAGQSCEMDALMEVGRQHGVPIIEDAAHALPATWRGTKVGALTTAAAVFSFYATKTITTGEGGMIVSRDQDLLARARTMRLHGINRDVFDRYQSRKPAWFYEVVAPGFKYNLPDVLAAIGVQQLRRVDHFHSRRAEIACAYSAAFRDLPLEIPAVAHSGEVHAWHLYVLRLQLEHLRIDRDRFVELLAEQGVGASVHFIPLHIQPYWRERYGLRPEDFPVADSTYRRAVSLPIYTRMSNGDVARVVDAVRAVVASSLA